MKKTLFIILILTLALSACVADEGSGALEASGVVEANELNLSPELGGRIVELNAAQGESVSAGTVLIRLDNSLLLAERANIEAAFDAVNANINAAEVAVASAELAYDQTLSAAISVEAETRIETWDKTKPSEFELPTWYFDKEERNAAIEAEVGAAQEALEKKEDKLNETSEKAGSKDFLEIEAALAEARLAFEAAEEVHDSAPSGDLKDAAILVLDDAKIDLEESIEDYDDALTTEGAEDILESRAEYVVAKERYDLAIDRLRTTETGANSPEVMMAAQNTAQAEAMLEQAKSALVQIEAQLALIDTQLEKVDLISPIDGVILTKSMELGETLSPGLVAMTIAPLDELTVTIYIPEDRYGEISLGDVATLRVDSFSEESFAATVVHIADQAEYTPRNVQTKEERQTTVFAIRLSVMNVDGMLKPGMPADLVFEE
ncbi:MAG: HlyD family efflux transporter periplasmic adaptor subunit [Anaerolineae bacterium]|nr:HlyD family efflux transporter periplasmic adaptor subunit [Anaerolineae bacterium]MBT7074265.1 HlyD family efflux transporter periplasmic adaptor subunit [Anaerolineae bacterium]MBT7782695.1 HlyD family efflux transporter periplasmic adaptor subunit [Anaerolineae bacterium]